MRAKFFTSGHCHPGSAIGDPPPKKNSRQGVPRPVYCVQRPINSLRPGQNPSSQPLTKILHHVSSRSGPARGRLAILRTRRQLGKRSPNSGRRRLTQRRNIRRQIVKYVQVLAEMSSDTIQIVIRGTRQQRSAVEKMRACAESEMKTIGDGTDKW